MGRDGREKRKNAVKICTTVFQKYQWVWDKKTSDGGVAG